jgi:phosphate starvation-inducible membrane PsiE
LTFSHIAFEHHLQTSLATSLLSVYHQIVLALVNAGSHVSKSSLKFDSRASYFCVDIKMYFMLICPCIVNQFLKMFQQDGTFCTVFYSLQTALHVSGDTLTHHQELE